MEKKGIHTETIEEIEIICTWFLLDIASKVDGRDVYLRNSIAKTISLLKTIDLLSFIRLYNEGWILYRSLIDRLVYLYYLIDNDNFTDFDEWTYLQLYEYRHNAKVDEKFKRLLNDPFFRTEKGDANKYSEIRIKKLNWEKPRAKDVLKSKNLDFIYKFGYDYASMHTHPMSFDGQREFNRMTGSTPNPYQSFDGNILINDSMLISSIILNLIISNMKIQPPDIFIDYLSEFKKLTYGIENNLHDKFQEVYDFFKSKA